MDGHSGLEQALLGDCMKLDMKAVREYAAAIKATWSVYLTGDTGEVMLLIIRASEDSSTPETMPAVRFVA